MTHVDVVIIGSGSAAQSAAFPCRKAGWSVAVIDSRPFGGTCELRGCEPKKILANAVALVDWSQRMQGKGISAPANSIAWSDLMRFKRSFTEPVPEQIEGGFDRVGIKSFHGRAHFIDANTLQVGDDTLTGRYIVIATGARHATLHIPGEDLLTTSTQFLDLETLPRRILFVGGGYIAFEFGQIAALAGAQVQIVHHGAHALNKFDPELVAQVIQTTEEMGARVQTSSAVTAVERGDDGLRVHVQHEGQEQILDADMVVHAAGRVPEIADLQLETAGVAYTAQGISVNDYLQSVSNPAVYAAGDAVNSGGWALTPVSNMQGKIAAQNMLKGNHIRPDYTGIPSIVFTTPTLARVGLDEETARSQGYDFTVHHEDTSQWYSARRLQLSHTGFKILVEAETGHILGAHLLGSHAEDIINIFALAIRARVPATELQHMIYSFPTAASDIPFML